jgi:hypothetical protein
MLWACPDNELKVVHDPPVVSITEPSEGSTFYEGQAILFKALVQTSDADTDLTDITHQWVTNSTTACESAQVNADGTATCTFTYEEVGESTMQITVTDPRLDTATAIVTVNIEANTPPEITVTEPTDGQAFQPGDLVVFSGTATDVEDDPEDLTITILSSIDGELPFAVVPASSGEWTQGGTLSSGTHLLTAKVADTSGKTGQDSLTVYVNAKPGPPGVTITPDPSESGLELLAQISTPSVDAEGDTVNYTYDWYADGSLYSSSANPKVPLAVTVRDDFWEVYVFPFDGFSYGEAGYANITIDNSAPRLDSARIDPTPADTTDVLTALPITWFDQDSDPEKYRYKWFHEGVEDTSETTDTFPFEKTTRGDKVQVEITPYDAYDDGEAAISTEITIANSPPTAPVVTVTPSSPQPEDALTCNLTTASTDADGDFITYSYEWYQNGTLTSITTHVVTSDNTVDGDTWECVCTPSDGTDDGPYGSDSIGINDSVAPDPPVIDDPYGHRNETEWTLTGLCESGCDLTFYCLDGSSSWTDTDSCDVDGTFETTMSLVRGEISECYATCEDASGNVSGDSNTVSTEVCDPYDTYEDDLGYGDTSTDAIDEWSSLPDDGSSFIIEGNIIGPDASDGDWYVISTSDTLTDDVSAGSDDYDLHVELTHGAGTYSFIIYKGGAGFPECTSFTTGYTEYNDYIDSATWSNGNLCSSGDALGYDNCSDMSNDYWIYVIRDSGVSESCEYYELTISNGA